MGAVTPALELRDLRVLFGLGEAAHVAVDGVSLAVAPGESFGLVGESGSGKSTLLRAVCGLVRPSGGEIRLDGEPVPTPRPRSFYRRVQMVFQDPYASLHPGHMVDQILAEPLLVNREGEIETRVREALAAVGLGAAHRFRYPHELSGGPRQRVAIARAIIRRPELLLLDEPTSALDASIQAEILNLMDELRTARRLTLLLVSHDLAVIGHMCDRVMVLRGGRTVEQLGIEQLRQGRVATGYARDLLLASEGFRRAPAATAAG
jgi:peptide/nickel transport system ATP-binding protein